MFTTTKIFCSVWFGQSEVLKVSSQYGSNFVLCSNLVVTVYFNGIPGTIPQVYLVYQVYI